MDEAYDIAIIGGGLAGLTSANLLSRSGFNIVLVEKKRYPFHRVCGEYVSNEIKPFLQKNEMYPEEIEPVEINEFHLSSVSGSRAIVDLPLGGFGISRYSFDQFLAQRAIDAGCRVLFKTVESVEITGDVFNTKLSDGSMIYSKMVIGSFGKNSTLDRTLGRTLPSNQPTFLAVKYHIRAELPENVIALHNFEGGYCGVSRVENGLYNLCYLSETKNLKQSGNIDQMEEDVLYKNPFLKDIFQQSEMVFEKPLTISKVTFQRKSLVVDNVLMCGDAAGMIMPLCGNGMAMAIHSAKILSEIIRKNFKSDKFDLEKLQKEYEARWKGKFSLRLMAGRKLQNIFGKKLMSEIGVGLLKTPIAKSIIRLTHGQVIQ